MTYSDDFSTSLSRFSALVKDTIASYPCARSPVAMTRSPGVVDVMGGIVEDSGSLVLTATLGLAVTASIWRVDGGHVHLRRAADGAKNGCDLPIAAFDPSGSAPEGLSALCREAGAEWALPSCLTLRQALKDGVIPGLDLGLMILLHSDFPPDADFSESWVQAAATIDGLCRLFGAPADRLQRSRVCAEAVAPLTNLYNLRAPITALCGSPDGSLLQLRFQPKMMCQSLELPAGVIVSAARTHLARPTTRRRMVDTRMCAEMGRRMIAQLQQHDGARSDPAAVRLATITPAEYVNQYRDRLPSRITGEAFVAKFGTLRGIDGQLNPENTYKIRSRAEHHIYENNRVHEFATCIVRARRNASPEALARAGKLMYASHWSHSQRCGIGGMEADQLVTAIRSHGPEAGLFGAKVTGGGEGGEIVVLMRDDERAHIALAEAVATAEAAADHTILTFGGAVGGAEFFQPPKLDGILGSPSAV